MKKLRDDNQFLKSEIIQKAVWYFDKLPKIRVTPDCSDDNNPPKEIEDMVNQELIEDEIQITQKRKRKQTEQDKTRPELKKQKKGKKGNTKNMTTRRTIYNSSYVYGYICQKKQTFYFIAILCMFPLIFFVIIFISCFSLEMEKVLLETKEATWRC
ncbi:uncharacterized protein LOC134686094 [Mytilus trossulus]|uniref:uncharacterized protein LOC134686094 n=1 Tax=Mytilus trossulus TaxID=6551 RepID=UPI0030052509